MGVFDFVKEAGEKLGFGKDEPAPGATAGSATATADEDEAVRERNMGSDLMQLVVRLGLDIDGLVIHYDDGVATIEGTTPTNAEREKVILAVGNTRGVARVDDRIEVESPEPEATLVTVQKGDSLSKIAKEQYGDANAYMKIFEANRPMLSDPDRIYPGQVLRIPPKG